MNYMNLLNQLLEKNMSERGFKLWNGIKNIIPNIWGKPSSSTGKYHKKENGHIPNIDEHTFEMLYAAVKLFSMFNIKKNTNKADMILLSIVLHDSLKYGKDGNRKYCDSKHDKLAADMIKENEATFRKLLNEDEFDILEESVRYHSGRWSTDIRMQQNFQFNNFYPYTQFIHMLDMMSTNDLIKIWDKDLKEE